MEDVTTVDMKRLCSSALNCNGNYKRLQGVFGHTTGWEGVGKKEREKDRDGCGSQVLLITSKVCILHKCASFNRIES